MSQLYFSGSKHRLQDAITSQDMHKRKTLSSYSLKYSETYVAVWEDRL